MAITATQTNTLEVNETPTGLYYTSGVPKSKVPFAHTLNATSTPPASLYAAKTVALVAGSAAIDLTTLTDWGLNASDPSASGLKLQMLTIQAVSTNTGAITITPSVSNGYELFGAACSVILSPGMELTLYGNDATPEVGSSAKAITLAGTGTDSVKISMVFG